MSRYHGLSQHVDFDQLPSPGDRFKLEQVIGEGTYGEVYCARDQDTGLRVAIKILENVADNVEEIEEEYLVLRDLSLHPNIPLFSGLFLKRGTSQEDDQLWFVMELCGGGSVTDLVQGLKKRGGKLTTEQIGYILHETVQALVYLHQHHCMHRDVKGHNILLTDDATVKLVDFGVSSHLGATLGRRSTSVGTPYWMAPEVIACEQQLDASYDARCDIWSLGVTAIELAEGDPPLADLHPMRALFQARRELKEEIDRQRAEGRVSRQPEVTTKHGQLKSDRKSRPQPMYMDDLAALESLSEDAIVKQLEHRYEQKQIYTYIGDILVAVNPFADFGLYSDAEQRRYRGQARSENPPHIFAVADAAYQALLHQRQNQAIVISGESGAGKTESANLLLKQLVFLGKAPNRNLEERILQVNPIMEAFGNAQTGINDNSSRFGKYLDLTMTNSGKVTGARISVYLLEHGERNFHVFYYLYDGLEWDKRLKQFHLDRKLRENHRFLSGDRTDKTTKQINVGRFQQVKEGFKLLGFKEEEVDAVYSILAAILHLVSKLLGVEACDLLEALTSNSVVTRGETITRNNTVAEAADARDAMAKGLYGRLFDWIVNQINRLLSLNRYTCKEPLAIGLLDIFGFENFNKNSFEQLCINIANEQIQYYFNQHIFTWEQQEYMAEGIPVDLVDFADNRPVLDMLLSRPMGLLALLDEESRFPRSSDSSLVSKFHNNIDSKHYVRPKSNALCFAVHHYAGRVVYQADGFLEKNKNFLPPEVIQLLRQSERDTVRFLFQCPLTKTGNLYSSVTGPPPTAHVTIAPAVSPHFNDHGSREKFSSRGLASQSRAQQTVATYFRYSLMDLLQKMVSGYPQFVRCVKPNDSRRPRLFDREKILKQLRYTGVMETIRIRQHGFSHRLAFAEFLRRYFFLAFGYDERVVANRDTCRLLLVRLKMDGWALGKTKVFLKYYHVEYLSKLYEDQGSPKRATGVWLQEKLMGVMNHGDDQEGKENMRRNRNQDEAAVIIQAHYRGYTVRRRWGAEVEARVKRVLASYNSPREAHAALQAEGLSAEDAAMIIERYYLSWRNANNKFPMPPPPPTYPRGVNPNKQQPSHKEQKNKKDKKNRAPDHQTELISFSQNVHMVNQDAHKFLRRNKQGIRLNDVREPPISYQRPRGFQLIPHLLNQVANEKRVEGRRSSQNKGNEKLSYYDALRMEMNSPSTEQVEPDDDSWDTPLIELEQKRRPSGGQPDGLDLALQRREMLMTGNSQAYQNVRRESQVLGAWHNAINKQPEKVEKISRIGRQVIGTALEQRIRELSRQESNDSINNGNTGTTLIQEGNKYVMDPPEPTTLSRTNNNHMQAMQFSPASDLRRLLRQDNSISYQQEMPGDEDTGPFNFKQLLRQTKYAPTESLRKRKGLSSNNSSSYDEDTDQNYPAQAPQQRNKAPAPARPVSHTPDSPTKRRAKPPMDLLRRKY
ncbi:hypothetical protein B566_EDAN004377 [Ephemera danica]|nr:hypothetical protein B566_EDAN004377 [Ephemera danica]